MIPIKKNFAVMFCSFLFINYKDMMRLQWDILFFNGKKKSKDTPCYLSICLYISLFSGRGSSCSFNRSRP